MKVKLVAMARIFVLVILIVVVKAAHKHHPKFPKVAEDYDSSAQMLRKVECSPDHENRRNEIIQKSKCGEPKDTFIHLAPQSAHQQVSPGAVWVKRCKGLCEYDTFGSKCVAITKHIIYVPIRIYNMKTNKETCSQYPVEEHLTCGCCAGGDSCAPPRVFDPPEPDYEVESV